MNIFGNVERPSADNINTFYTWCTIPGHTRLLHWSPCLVYIFDEHAHVYIDLQPKSHQAKADISESRRLNVFATCQCLEKERSSLQYHGRIPFEAESYQVETLGG